MSSAMVDQAGRRVETARVLLVEDNADIATLYRMALEIGGHQVTVAGDGEVGLSIASQLLPDLMLLDLDLPKIHGLAMLEQLRLHPEISALPVVILSNSDSSDEIRRGRELGALDFLTKSTTLPGTVAARVAEWVGWQPAPRRRWIGEGGLPGETTRPGMRLQARRRVSRGEPGLED